MSPPLQDAAFQSAYRQADRQLRLRHARVGCILALVLMPAGSLLDWFVYPHLVWTIIHARWLTDVVIAVVLVTLTTEWGKRHIRVLGSVWVLACAVAISWMIYLSEGAMSPYYAGLNLVIIIGCLLMPYTLREAAVVCGIVVLTYSMACLLHGGQTVDGAVLFNNYYFLLLTVIIAVTSCHYYNLRRIEDFRLRHELDKRNHELAELDRLKSEFFANISHELRTPLTLILAPVEDLLQRRDTLPARVTEALAMTKQNGLRLLKLINDLLEVVRLDARRGRGDSSREIRPIDLATYLPGVIDSVRHLATAKGLELTGQGQQTPLIVRGDPSSLERVFLNLLTNAIKFTPRGGAIQIRWAREADQSRVEVADTGIGIPEHDLPHIFERFRQVDGSATRRYQGVGLGLSLVRDLVEEHHGDLQVQSSLGVGTTFTLRLPLMERPDLVETAAAFPAAGGVALAAGGADGGEPQGRDVDPMLAALAAADRFTHGAEPIPDDLGDVGSGAHRVLVVDDEPDMRRFIVSILADEYHVMQAADGETGLEKARHERPDLIVCDLMLPGIDGLEVCRRLRADGGMADTKIVLLTARADEDSKLTALQRGADDFLTKPFSSVEVRTRLRNLLRAGSLQRSLRDRNAQLQETIRELDQTRAQLVQSEKMNALGSLAAGLLHEINNPLNYTLTALQVAQMSLPEDDDDLRDTLNDIDTGMKRIRDIITDLRAFAYPEKAGVRGPLDIREPIETALRFTAHERGDIDVVVEAPADGEVTGSRSQLTQVLVNLVTNAAKAVLPVADERTPEIRIVAERSGDRMRVRVRDNGVGIKPDDLPRVFDPFFTTRDVGQGMGLGLSICHTIMASHGGSISLRSQQGAWTEAVFDLPLARTGTHQ